MKWRNHLDIADAVADALALPPYLKEILRQASVEPDKHGERVLHFDGKGEPHLRWMRHHRPEAQIIESLLKKGRRAFLEGREDDAIWCVGKALHFLQDDCVSTGLLGRAHDEQEDEISNHRVSRETVAAGAREAEVSLNFMRECIRSVTPDRDPEVALNRAGLFSGAIAASVLRGESPDRGLLDQWLLTRRRFRMIVLPAGGALVIIALAVAVMVNEPVIALAALPGLLAPWANRRYWFLKEEMTWFRP